MQALAIAGGLIATAVGGAKLSIDSKMEDLYDERFHDLSLRQAQIYKNSVNLVNDKKVATLNSLKYAYATSGFSVNSGAGALEMDAVTQSFNKELNALSENNGFAMKNLEVENRMAHQTQNLKYLADISSTIADITSYAKMYSDYSGGTNKKVDNSKPSITTGGSNTGTQATRSFDEVYRDTQQMLSNYENQLMVF